jgi:hypothetical protein
MRSDSDSDAGLPSTTSHVPVLLRETIEWLAPPSVPST